MPDDKPPPGTLPDEERASEEAKEAASEETVSETTPSDEEVAGADAVSEEAAALAPVSASGVDTSASALDEDEVTESKGQVDTKNATQAPGSTRTSTGRGGTVGILAGVAIIATVLIRERPAFIRDAVAGTEPFYLLPVAVLLFALALSGFRVSQAGADGKLGRIGFIIAEAGAALALVVLLFMSLRMAGDPETVGGATVLSLALGLVMVGVGLFGAATLQAGILARGATLLMMVSLPLGAILDSLGAFSVERGWGSPVAFALGEGMHYALKLFGFALIWLGYSILKDSKAAPTPAVET